MNRRTRNQWRALITGIVIASSMLSVLSGCKDRPTDAPNEKEGDPTVNHQTGSKEENKDPITPTPTPSYVRTGDTTDFVTSGIDIDALLARPYDGTVPTAFSEGVFTLHSHGWGFDNETVLVTGNGTGGGMPITVSVDGVELLADEAVWRPSHVTSTYSPADENGQAKPTNIASTATVSATYISVYDPDGLVHLTDGIVSYAATPRNRWSNYVSSARSGDTVTFDFGCESRVTSMTVHPYDDGGATVLPAAMEVEYYVDGVWQKVPGQVCGEIQKETGVTITFDEITTEKLRLVLTPQSGKSMGLTEVEIFGHNENADILPLGLLIEEKKFVTADDVVTSIITVKNESEKSLEVTVRATPSVGYTETKYGALYVLFGGKALTSAAGVRTVTVGAGEMADFRFAMAFSNAKGKNQSKLTALFENENCVAEHAETFASWFEANVPYFECSDEQIMQTYYFRWLTYRNNVRRIEAEWDGYIISEFLPNVKWSGLYNSISCPAMHHFYEGRWIRDGKYLDDYQEFWFIDGANPRLYSFPIADAYYNRYLVTGDKEELVKYLEALDQNFAAWEESHFQEEMGLFFQLGDRDGMENGVGGDGLRPTINSYMYGDAVAIAKIARMVGNTEIAEKYEQKAVDIKEKVLALLWNKADGFFETVTTSGSSVGVRELIGYVPWYYNLPDDDATYAAAFAQLLDSDGFLAAYGPTTVEQRSSGFLSKAFGAGCRWDGPSWPFATAQTLTATANLLNNYTQNEVFDEGNWFDLLKTYAASQYKDGYSWIGEDLHPQTGEWIVDLPRSIHYNHSSYADLVITGLVGLRPTDSNDSLTVHPLLAEGDLTHFALENVSYRGHNVTVLYDADGSHYALGTGLKVFVDGYLMAESETLGALTVSLDTSEK